MYLPSHDTISEFNMHIGTMLTTHTLMHRLESERRVWKFESLRIVSKLFHINM